jgi:hypothetical protein
MHYITELHAQVFAIAFAAGVIGNLVASLVTAVYLHLRLNQHHRQLKEHISNELRRRHDHGTSEQAPHGGR